MYVRGTWVWSPKGRWVPTMWLCDQIYVTTTWIIHVIHVHSNTHRSTHTHTTQSSSSTFSLFDVHCSKPGSRLLSVYSDWSQCECLVFRQWLRSQYADFRSCCFLMGFFPLTHLNWLLLLFKLAVTFCIFVWGLFTGCLFRSDCPIW